LLGNMKAKITPKVTPPKVEVPVAHVVAPVVV
jgi:hypothetical protein